MRVGTKYNISNNIKENNFVILNYETTLYSVGPSTFSKDYVNVQPPNLHNLKNDKICTSFS